jgi:flagellar basal-body rod modification protein FlgD
MNALVSLRSLGSREKMVSAAKKQQSQEALAIQKSAVKLAAKSSSANASTSAAKAAKDSSDDEDTTSALADQLDGDTFLQLLVYQLQNQDPMSPMDNSDMIAQLAQFSSLEQMQSLNTNFESLSGEVQHLNFVSASSLVGQSVVGNDSSGNLVEGTVDRVYYDSDDGVVYAVVDSSMIALSDLLRIDGSAA